jgi:hypothetical protein
VRKPESFFGGPCLRITKLVVSRGHSVPTEGPDGEWVKTFYTVEAELGEGEDLAAARLELVNKINGWLGKPVSVEKALELDPAELDKLPWKPYREGHRAAWIFSNQQGAKKLAEAIRASSNGKVEIGDLAYRFSGPKEDRKLFISRNPLKPRKNSDDNGWKRRDQALKNVEGAGKKMVGDK